MFKHLMLQHIMRNILWFISIVLFFSKINFDLRPRLGFFERTSQFAKNIVYRLGLFHFF